jgi:hypothetical protein
MVSLRRPALIASLCVLAVGAALLPGCAADDGAGGGGPAGERIGQIQADLTKAERMARYAQIRDAAATRGIPNNAYMLAGIAYAETNLAHCWSEATWACQGPNSSDCGGGPVIAGASDGPCSAMQGGLGMFQFDAGTFTDTLNKYGADVLTVAGNVSHAIDYVVNMVKISAYTTNAETDAKALAWVNSFDVNNGTLRDEWIKTVTHYYNGCLPSYSCWSARYKHYDDSLQAVIDDTGLPFWQSAGQGPDWKATFVSQSFPFASQPFLLHPGETSDGYIEMKNEGKATWKPGEVFLGTTQPRDADSPLAAPGWVSGHRAATIDKEVAPGDTGRFNFTVKAPATLGDFDQFFGLVRESVAWFSDGGQGGPPDNQIEIKVTVEAAPCPAGVGATWVCQGSDRVSCDPATGAVSQETCPSGCQDAPGGPQCAPGGAGGSGAGGAGQGGSSQGGSSQGGTSQGGSTGSGSSGKGGSGGKASGGSSQGGNPGTGGKSSGSAGGSGATSAAGGAGQGAGGKNSAGTGVAGGAGGSADGESEAVVQSNSESESGCRAAGPRPGNRQAAWWIGLALAGIVSRRSAPRSPKRRA